MCAPTRAAAGYSAMMHSSIRNLALAFVALGAVTPTLAGCAPYKVVQQSGPPSALQGVQQVAVSFDWSQVQVAGKPEAAYLAEKSAEEQQDFQTIKQETDAAHRTTNPSHAQDLRGLLRPLRSSYAPT